MKIQESGENYLETILILHKKYGVVRSVDVANEMGFTKASVSRAMSILRKAGFLTMEEGGNLALTPTGQKRAEDVYERHTVLQSLLRGILGVSEETAARDACRMEHVLSEETFSKIKSFVEQNKTP